MTIRKFQVDDFEELVEMYYNFICEVHHNRKIGAKYFFYRKVMEWINKGLDIILADDNGKLAGFTLAYIDDMKGITEPVYQGDMCYVKPEYRKGRAAYMLYKNVYNYGKEQGLLVTSNGRIENGIDQMVIKHFNAKPTFQIIEG